MTVDLDPLRSRLAALGRPVLPGDVAAAMRDSGQLVSDTSVMAATEALRRESTGAGPLESLLRTEGVTDVLVNGAGPVWIDAGRGLEQTSVRLRNESEVRRLAQRLAASAGRRLDDAHPYVDARMADGTRLHAVLGTLSDPGTCLSLRVPTTTAMTLADWVSVGSLPAAGAQVLQQLIAARIPFLITGGTGSGKTTLLATLLGHVPPDQRLIIVEDSRELRPDHPHCIRLEGRPRNAEGAGLITLTDLVRQALRMRPDRLVLGEVRGAELCDLLTALNTGHEGGCGTVHANSPADLPARLEALAALGGMGREALHAQVAAALQVVVHVQRDADRRRRVGEICVLGRDPDGLVRTERACEFTADGRILRGAGIVTLERLLAR